MPQAGWPGWAGLAGDVTQTFPLALRMQGRLAVVIGGSQASGRHVVRLLASGARVLVVAPELTGELADLSARGLIAVRSRGYRDADLDGAWLVVACAEDDSVNAQAADDAGRRHIWCAGGGGATASALLPAPEDPSGLTSPGTNRPGHRVLVLGGARSGKSAAAESMLADAMAVDYVATGQPAGGGDSEWDQRVREHQARRPVGWRTLETCDIAGILADQDSAAPMLVDCLATWLARIMDDSGLWSGDPDADGRLAEHVDLLAAAWRQTTRPAVAVSNEVGCGIVPATTSGRRFRDELGWLNSRIADASDEVWMCTAGIPVRLR